MTAFDDWCSPTWLAEVTGWLDATLAAVHRTRTGPVEQPRTRPWGTVLRAPTSDGPVWLKAPAPSLRFELTLLQALAGHDGAPQVLGTDPSRGLLLLADGGTSLVASYPDRSERAGKFAAAWPTVGALQRASTPLVPALLAAGVADFRPALLPARFDEVLDRARADHGDHATDAEVFARLAVLRGRFAAVADELAGSKVPDAVDHNDVHDGNVLIGAAGDTVVVDWGDAVVAHPFAVLVMAEQTLTSLLGDVSPEHPDLVTARRGYLAGFAELAPHEDLERTAWLARTAAEIGRAWVWQRALDTFADATAFEPPPHWPRDFDRGALRPLARLADRLERSTA
ncbi:phosphotransferase [Jatrophihabitans sp. YIM 134969]